MNINSIKEHLHKQIDLIEDEEQLQILNDVATDYVSNKKFVLTKEQEQRLQQSLEQAKNGQLISHEELNKKVAQWLTR